MWFKKKRKQIMTNYQVDYILNNGVKGIFTIELETDDIEKAADVIFKDYLKDNRTIFRASNVNNGIDFIRMKDITIFTISFEKEKEGGRRNGK